MKNINSYASWDNYSVWYDGNTGIFALKCSGKNNAVYDAKITDIISDGRSIGGIENFGKYTCKSQRTKTDDSVFLSVKYTGGNTAVKELSVKFILSSEGIKLKIGIHDGCFVKFSGKLSWGDGGCVNTYPMSNRKNRGVIRSGVGPASSSADNMLFDRLTDSAVCLDGKAKIRIKYDHSDKCYKFEMSTGNLASEKTMTISVQKDIIAKQYNIDYVPLSKNRTFKKPPAGWMTWYAVKFDACEEKVLKNARWMSESLKEYGADCIWVDWEWYHKDLTGSRDDGADTFNPDKEKYPNGLKYISDEIRKMGLEPALWIGFTNDVALNDYIKENPEIVFADEPEWCGRYFFDFTHPKYLNEFLPKALANVQNWGYEAVKYDTLPMSMMKHEKHHTKLYDTTLTTKEIYRSMIERTRKILGDKCYMLSCAAYNDADVLWGAGVFDSARVGDDIFKWEDFLKEGVSKTLRFYPLHYNVLYPDCDNVVMREEFNNIYQAASRIYFVSMLGIPITFGDEFDALDDKRIDFIKSCLPVLDIHPMDALSHKSLSEILKINMAVDKEWECYNVLSVFNTKSVNRKDTVSFEKDLGLDYGDYLVYDYTYDKFIGIKDSEFEVELSGCESRIFSIRKKTDIPQIVSTSRHISQGAAEINNVIWNEESLELKISVELIQNAPYTITLYVPDDYTSCGNLEKSVDRIYKKTIVPKNSGTHEIVIKFKNKRG